MICHDTLKSHKTVFIVKKIFFNDDLKAESPRSCFISEVTCSVSVGVLSVSSLLCNVFFTA